MELEDELRAYKERRMNLQVLRHLLQCSFAVQPSAGSSSYNELNNAE